MQKFISALTAVLFSSASFASVAINQAMHPANTHGLLASTAAIALADEDGDDYDDDQGEDRGNAHECVNPAGNERGWCKHRNRYARYSTISGTVIAVNGDLVQFREDNGATISLNQGALLNAGMGLQVGGHYSLRGYWSNNMFVAQTNGGSYGNNGYPYGGSTTIQGVITSIHGSRVTLLQGLFSTITVDDQQALNNGSAQELFVGRNVTAYGFWNGNVFYATSIG